MDVDRLIKIDTENHIIVNQKIARSRAPKSAMHKIFQFGIAFVKTASQQNTYSIKSISGFNTMFARHVIIKRARLDEIHLMAAYGSSKRKCHR